MAEAKRDYPAQAGSVTRGKWRMQRWIDQRLKPEDLEKEESKLWQNIKSIADRATPPPVTCPLFPGSELVGYGWEWAIYGLPSEDRVVKVPAGIFPEVNDLEYLQNSQIAYGLCKKYFGPFVVETTLERRDTVMGPLNVLFQKKLPGEQHRYINPSKLSPSLRESFIVLGGKMIEILHKLEWAPDFNLYKKEHDGKQVWSIWNIMLEDGQPRIFDFTAYYDVFRLYPDRTKREVKIKGDAWKQFLSEL